MSLPAFSYGVDSANNNLTLAPLEVEQSTVVNTAPYGRLLETHAVAEDHATFVIGMFLLIGIAFCFCALLTRLTKPPTLYRTICYSRISRNEIVAWIRLDEERAARRTTLRKLPSFVVFLQSIMHCVRPTALSTSLLSATSSALTDAVAYPSPSSTRFLIQQQRPSVGSLPTYDVATTPCLSASSAAVRTETPPPRYEDVSVSFVNGATE